MQQIPLLSKTTVFLKTFSSYIDVILLYVLILYIVYDICIIGILYHMWGVL